MSNILHAPRNGVAAPDVPACALWLQATLGLWVFDADHPGTPRCTGLHRRDAPYYDKNGQHQRGKHPASKWSRDATLDPDKIRAMLSRGLRNIGVACKKSGLLVVDEDKPGAYQQYATETGQHIEPTFTVVTSKGHHFYYRMPEGVHLGNGVGALAGRGIDIRGNGGEENLGGYVIGPGSVHENGVLYTPVNSAAPILPAPGWLIAALQSGQPSTVEAGERKPFDWAQFRKPRTGTPLKTLTSLVDVVLTAKPGDRNNKLYWSACRAFEHSDRGLFTESEARGALLEAAHCAGLAGSESEATLNSARTRVKTGGSR